MIHCVFINGPSSGSLDLTLTNVRLLTSAISVPLLTLTTMLEVMVPEGEVSWCYHQFKTQVE